jgi:hypothetical protein
MCTGTVHSMTDPVTLFLRGAVHMGSQVDPGRCGTGEQSKGVNLAGGRTNKDLCEINECLKQLSMVYTN